MRNALDLYNGPDLIKAPMLMLYAILTSTCLNAELLFIDGTYKLSSQKGSPFDSGASSPLPQNVLCTLHWYDGAMMRQKDSPQDQVLRLANIKSDLYHGAMMR
eukprot:1160717-Pelagomonas_calceolata.AAC.11